QYKKYSPSSESYQGDGEVLNEAEKPADEEQTQTAAEKPAKPRRTRIAAELPRVEVVHDITDKTCACCGHTLHRMGEEVSEQIEFIPAQIRVIKNIRPKYSCRACENKDTEVAIQIADVVPS